MTPEQTINRVMAVLADGAYCLDNDAHLVGFPQAVGRAVAPDMARPALFQVLLPRPIEAAEAHEVVEPPRTQPGGGRR